MAGEVLTRRELNRTLLGRQMPLERRAMAAPEAIGHLVGMQAQNPLDPYIGLWSRLEGFDPEELSELVASGAVVRAWLMRGTIHLVTARDCLVLRPVMDSVIRAALTAQRFGQDTAAIDRSELAAAAREVIGRGPMTRAELGRALAERWPEVAPDALGLAASSLVPLLQVPPRGTWGATHRATMALVDEFLGEPLTDDDSPDEAILRYLRTYGPAAPKDVRAWCYKTGLRDAIDRLRPELRTFRDESGTELLDVPDGELFEAELEAPPRFLPEYDNAVLSHDDRSRVIAPGNAERPWWKGTVLVDGFAAGTWRFERAEGPMTLAIAPWSEWPKRVRDQVAAEGERLLGFAAADAPRTGIRFDA